MPKFSIITICKNQTDVEETCESIINQTYSDYEWIVIDGGSTDGTLEILSHYKNSIKHLVSEDDAGIYDAMNKGIGLAKGEYLLFLNGGDKLHNRDVLRRVVPLLAADVVYGNAYEIDEFEDEKELCKVPENIDDDFFIYSRLLHPATFIRRELFDHYGLYDERLKIVADWEKFIVFQRGGASFKKADLSVAEFKLGGISSNDEHKRKHQNERACVLKKYFTSKEIKNCYKKFPPTFLERIYSLKNEGTCKVVRLLFMSFRIDFSLFR